MKETNYIRLEFPSRSSNESFARAAAAAFAAQLDPTMEELGDLRTAVSEAVTNAIVHAYPDSIGKIAMRMRIVEPDEAMLKEQAAQKKLMYGGWGAFALCMLPVLLYMADGTHFPNDDLEQVMGQFAIHVFPWIILGLACLIVSAVLQGRSIRREYDAIMARIKEEKAAGIKAEPKAAAPARNLNGLRIAILVLAVVFIVAGIFNGSMTAVVNKAIRICTECVGLG